MGSLADLTLGDIGRALVRYRPVAVTVAIILVVIALLPGPNLEEFGGTQGLPGPVQVPAAAAGPATSTPVTTPDPSFGSTASSSFSSPSGSSFSTPSSGSLSSDNSSSFGSDDSSSDFSDSDSSSFSTVDDDFSSSEEEESTSLSVTTAAWASRTGGTPLGSSGVPDGLLPVGKRIGQRDKISFVRLSGGGTQLVLAPDDASSRMTTGEVLVSACRITTRGWAAATNLTFEQAPKFDETSCVVASVDTVGRLIFDLTLFPDRADDRGFALLPTGSSIDYQLNLRPS